MWIGAKQMNKTMTERDAQGRFQQGCKPGPGRPKKKAIQLNDAPLWSYEMLRRAWLTFKTANAYSQNAILNCKCGNCDPQKFDYQLDLKGAKLRARCKLCGRWNDYREKHAWHVQPLPRDLNPEEAAAIAIQREAH
jgi:hypothetical protein